VPSSRVQYLGLPALSYSGATDVACRSETRCSDSVSSVRYLIFWRLPPNSQLRSMYSTIRGRRVSWGNNIEPIYMAIPCRRIKPVHSLPMEWLVLPSVALHSITCLVIPCSAPCLFPSSPRLLTIQVINLDCRFRHRLTARSSRSSALIGFLLSSSCTQTNSPLLTMLTPDS
jgi:hypothetical protein